MTPEERAEAIFQSALKSQGQDKFPWIKFVAAHIKEAIREETEACAKIADAHYDRFISFSAREIAQAIRTRGENK